MHIKKLPTFAGFRPLTLGLTCLALATSVVACDDSDAGDTSAGEGGVAGEVGTASTTGSNTTGTAGTATAGTTGGTDTTGGDTGIVCADPADPAARVMIAGDLVGETRWTCDKVYVLTNHVFVRTGTLTIDAGTTVLGAAGSALVIEKDAMLSSNGSELAPVVFTSVLPVGQRSRGDWGGVVLLGTAQINLEGGVGLAEGFANAPTYGGTNAAHNCGNIAYTRVEWAGYEISDGNELNGVTFYACGTATQVNHLQVHMGKDDGIEFFGGAFNLDHIVVTGAADDSVDIDQGFRGNIQYLLVAQDPAIGDNGFEISNQGTDFNAPPLNHPRIANATIIGSGPAGQKSKGVTFKEGTQAEIYSSVFHSATGAAVLATHPETRARAEAGGIVLNQNLFFVFGNPAFDTDDAWSPTELGAWITNSGNTNGVDPMLGSVAWGSANPVPAAGSPVAGLGTNAAGFEPTTYAGAVAPGDVAPWTAASWINFGQ